MDEKSKHWVITGATGFLGRHFLHRVLSAEADIRVTILMRGKTQQSAEARLMRIMREVSQSYARPFDPDLMERQCRVLLADITLPKCGLSAGDLARLCQAEQSTFWHLAASLDFEQSHQHRIEEHNVMGTEMAIDLASTIGSRQFLYVSTAYACGMVAGSVPEELHRIDGPFANAYERSKCMAEHRLARLCRAAQLEFHVLRPSIIVGLSDSAATAGGETGLYGFTRELLRTRRRFANHPRPVRLAADGNAEVNLVHVDHVAERMMQLQMDGFGSNSFAHLTSLRGPTVREAIDAITDAVGIQRFQFVRELPTDASAFELVLSKRLGFYSSYLKNSKHFQTRHGGVPEIAAPTVRRLVENYLKERASDRLTLLESTIHGRDGFPLHVAHNAQRPGTTRDTVVVINALGMPHAALGDLTSALSETYDVVTWESRGAPELDGVLDEKSARFARHVDDLEDVLTRLGVVTAHVLGWCTGADVGLAFLARHPERVLSFSAINGGFVRISPIRLPFQRNLERIVRRTARSAASARFYYDLLVRPNASTGDGELVEGSAESSVQAARACLNQDLMHLTGAPLQSPEVLLRYSMLLEHYFDEAPTPLPPSTVPAFFGTAKDDEIAPYQATLAVAAQFHDAQVYFAETGGHFAVCVDRAMIDELLAFLARQVRVPVERSDTRMPSQVAREPRRCNTRAAVSSLSFSSLST